MDVIFCFWYESTRSLEKYEIQQQILTKQQIKTAIVIGKSIIIFILCAPKNKHFRATFLDEKIAPEKFTILFFKDSLNTV